MLHAKKANGYEGSVRPTSNAEQGLKTAQNVAAGLAGIVIWPIWFGMDFKGAAAKDAPAIAGASAVPHDASD